jgi:hypothetical protein
VRERPPFRLGGPSVERITFHFNSLGWIGSLPIKPPDFYQTI